MSVGTVANSSFSWFGIPSRKPTHGVQVLGSAWLPCLHHTGSFVVQTSGRHRGWHDELADCQTLVHRGMSRGHREIRPPPTPGNAWPAQLAGEGGWRAVTDTLARWPVLALSPFVFHKDSRYTLLASLASYPDQRHLVGAAVKSFLRLQLSTAPPRLLIFPDFLDLDLLSR